MLFQLEKPMIMWMRNSQKQLFELKEQRLCSSGCLRTCFSNRTSNDHVNVDWIHIGNFSILEKQRLCSSGFRRPCFSNRKSNDSVNAEFTETTLRIRKATSVLVWISQTTLFQVWKQWFCWNGIHKIHCSKLKSNGYARLEFAQHNCPIKNKMILLIRNSRKKFLYV